MKPLIALLILELFSCGEVATTADTKTIDTTQSVKETTINYTSTSENKQYNKDIYERYIDPRLKNYLDNEFKEWTLPAPSRWDTVWFNQYKSDSTLVNYISGDFDCNQQKDFVLLFQKANGELSAYAFLSSGNSIKAVKLMDLGINTGEQIEFGVELLPPGKYNYMDPESEDAPSVKINCNAVQVLSFEKGAETFYWEKGKLKSIMTGD
jgi:hypothetical protein